MSANGSPAHHPVSHALSIILHHTIVVKRSRLIKVYPAFIVVRMEISESRIHPKPAMGISDALAYHESAMTICRGNHAEVYLGTADDTTVILCSEACPMLFLGYQVFVTILLAETESIPARQCPFAVRICGLKKVIP